MIHKSITIGGAGNTFYKVYPCAPDPPGDITQMGPIAVQTIPVIFDEERIEDDLGRSKSNPVEHRKKSWFVNTDQYPMTLPRADGNGGKVQYWGYEPLWVTSSKNWLTGVSSWGLKKNLAAHDTPPGWTIGLADIPENVLRNECVERAKQLKADVLLNLLEANQVWPAIKSLATCIGEMSYHWGRLRKQIKIASGAYLAWKFGVSPILSDLTSIHKHLGRLKSDFDRHANGEVFRTVVKHEPDASFSFGPVYHGPYNGVIWQEQWYYGTIVDAPTVRYVLIAKPKVQYKTELFKALDYVMSRFATSPASLAWEKIPFSFVVDWFVDLRGALSLLDKCVGFEPYQILGFTRSLSYRVKTSMSVIHRETCSGGQLNNHSAGHIEFSHYERLNVSNTSNLVSWKPRFGKNQAAISAALIAQQLSTLRAKR